LIKALTGCEESDSGFDDCADCCCEPGFQHLHYPHITPELGFGPEPHSEFVLGAHPELGLEAHLESRPEAQPGSQPGSRSGSETGSNSGSETDSRLDSKPESESGSKPGSEKQNLQKPNSQQQSLSQSGSQSGSESDSGMAVEYQQPTHSCLAGGTSQTTHNRVPLRLAEYIYGQT